MNTIKSMLEKITPMWTLILSSLLLLMVIVFGMTFLVAHLRDDEVIEIQGEVATDFRVFYLDRVFYPANDFFSENPIPDHLHFLMSFTDYLEVDNSFNLHLDKEVEIFYSYDAVENLVIRYMGVKDGVSNPVVFESSMPLSTMSGSVFSDTVVFPITGGSSPGGTYVVSPKDYTDFYLEFVETQRHLMAEENVIAEGLRGFSAELLVYFTYTVTIPELNFTETVMEGYRLSLSTEVFTMALMGNSGSSFNGAVTLNVPPPPVTLPRIIIFIGAAALSAFGLIKGLRGLFADPDKNRQKVLTILRKYSNEIIVSDVAPDLSQYQLLQVDDFRDLLRLAINLNKHIMCYHNYLMAEFTVLVEGKAYHYRVDYNESQRSYGQRIQ